MIYNNNLVYSLVDINFAVYLCKLLMAQHTPNTSLTLQGELLAIGAKYQKAGESDPTYNRVTAVAPSGATITIVASAVDVTGVCQLDKGTEMVMPGDNVEMDVELIVPIAMEDNLRFAIREGGRTVGAGVVSKIVE